MNENEKHYCGECKHCGLLKIYPEQFIPMCFLKNKKITDWNHSCKKCEDR